MQWLIVNPMMMQAIKNWIVPSLLSFVALLIPLMSILPFYLISYSLQNAQKYENTCSTNKASNMKLDVPTMKNWLKDAPSSNSYLLVQQQIRMEHMSCISTKLSGWYTKLVFYIQSSELVSLYRSRSRSIFLMSPTMHLSNHLIESASSTNFSFSLS